MENFSIKSIKSNRLRNDEIKKICKLKNTFWKYGLRENFKWFKRNVHKEDTHIILEYKKKIIGYNLLRLRKFLVSKKKKNYFYFDTLLIHKKFRNKKLSNLILEFNNRIFKKKKIHGFLICKKGIQPLYKKYGWKRLDYDKFLIKEKKYKKNSFIGMINNYKNFTSKKKHIYYIEQVSKT